MKEFSLHDYLAYTPEVQGFFDPHTHTVSYVVADPHTQKCAIIDSVMDYEPHSATLSSLSADALIAYVRAHHYTVEWILETHVHADHLSAAPYIQEVLGGRIAIGRHIVEVQEVFGKVFNEGTEFARDGSQFDRLFDDEDTFMIGDIPARALYVPGHTPADMAYVIGDALFVGDTLFMPDYGTARCDFPGGSAASLFSSIQKLFTLPEELRVFMCHDYLPEGRTEYIWETTLGEQKKYNIHVHEGVAEPDFIQTRTARDAMLGMPTLIIPSLQVNMRAGELPHAKETGQPMLSIPVNSVFRKKEGI